MDVRLLRLERSHPADTFSPWKIVKPEYGGLSISDAHVTTVQYPTIQYNDDQLVARANIASCLAEVFSSDDGRLAKIDGWTGW